MARDIVATVALAASLACAWAVVPAVAGAQSASEMSAARDLFREGLEAARQQRWEDARAAFERSLAITERASTLVNLAGAQAQTGRLVASAASYRRFLEIAEGRDARLRPQATEALREVEARLPQLTLALDGLSPGDDVRIDDEPIAQAAIGAAFPVDPGEHTVVVRRDDAEVARERFTVAERERLTVRLDVRDAPAVALTVPTQRDPASPSDTGQGGDDGLWIGAGVGIGVAVVAAIAIGVGVAVSSGGEPTYYTGNLGDGMIRF